MGQVGGGTGQLSTQGAKAKTNYYKEDWKEVWKNSPWAKRTLMTIPGDS
jgi:hypothetical protein